MVFRLNKISVMSFATIVAILYTAVGVILGFVILLGALFNVENEGIWALGPWAIIVLPLVNVVLGFLTGMFIAGSYNLIIEWGGRGIELEFVQEEAVNLKKL